MYLFLWHFFNVKNDDTNIQILIIFFQQHNIYIQNISQPLASYIRNSCGLRLLVTGQIYLDLHPSNYKLKLGFLDKQAVVFLQYVSYIIH